MLRLNKCLSLLQLPPEADHLGELLVVILIIKSDLRQTQLLRRLHGVVATLRKSREGSLANGVPSQAVRACAHRHVVVVAHVAFDVVMMVVPDFTSCSQVGIGTAYC